MTEPDIAKLRISIDEVDDKIIALLNARSDFVKQVGMTKKKRQQDGQAFIRSGREAALVRRIYAQFASGSFPAPAAAQLWRLIICASLSLESQLTVTAYAPESSLELYWLAREYFGSFTPVAKQSTSKRTLGDVLDGKAEVGVLKLPDESLADQAHDNTWWTELPEGIRIFACIPFVLPKGAEVKALAVAKVQPEATSDDVSFIRLETDLDISQSRLKSLFDKHSLNVRWLAVDNSASGKRRHLIEITGFVTDEDKSLQALKAETGASVLAITWLGAYALPIIL